MYILMLFFCLQATYMGAVVFELLTLVLVPPPKKYLAIIHAYSMVIPSRITEASHAEICGKRTGPSLYVLL